MLNYHVAGRKLENLVEKQGFGICGSLVEVTGTFIISKYQSYVNLKKKNRHKPSFNEFLRVCLCLCLCLSGDRFALLLDM